MNAELFAGLRVRLVAREAPLQAQALLGIPLGIGVMALLLVMLLGWLPFVGWLALLALTVAGFGACVLELVRGRRMAVA